jgi:TolB-like protein/DNA-binding winged helix-turn-helix (wHTH) protein
MRSGKRLKLEKIPMELLMLLVTKDGVLVTRQEIVDRLWGRDVFLDTEHGINTAIRKVRAALKDDPSAPRFIQTIPGKGYRFVAEANVVLPGTGSPLAAAKSRMPSSEGQPSPTDSVAVLTLETSVAPPAAGRATKSLITAAAVVVLLSIAAVPLVSRIRQVRIVKDAIHIKSLAVLPLENLSGDPTQEYFADGMTDEVITVLAKNPALRVISRTSVMQYKKAHRPLPDIARELGVDGILEGSVERSGNHVHLNVQLIYAPQDRHVWAESYDRELADMDSLPGDLARTIAQRVGQTVAASPPSKLRVKPEAHDAYLLGRYYWFAFQTDKGREYFQKAIDLQPDYAAGWSGIADSYLGDAIGGIARPANVVPQGEAAARKAVELDDSLAEAHNSMAAAYFCRWDLERAERESARALELNPGLAESHHFRAYVLEGLNRTEDAVEEERKAMELDPFARPWALVYALIRARQFKAALTEAMLRSQAQPSNADLHGALSDAYLANGMDREAAHEMETALQLDGDPKSAAAVHKAFTHGGMQAVLEWQLRDFKKRAASQYVPWLNFAGLSATLKRKDETLLYLENAYHEREPKLAKMQNDPDFDFLRSDPRYQTLVREMDLGSAH